MNENETLREQMWDLCYGLLSAEEVAALHKQIKSDPAAARLYAEVRLQADLVASAAKVEDASVTLCVPDGGRKVQRAGKSHSGTTETPTKPAKSEGSGKKSFPTHSYRAANWLAALAATALLSLIGYGLYAPSRRGASSLPVRIVASVYAKQPLQSGLTQNLKVVATNDRGEPASTSLRYRVVHDGNVLVDNQVQTNESGEAQLSLPGSAIQPGAVFEVQTQSDKQSGSSQEFFQNKYHHRADGVAPSPKLVVPLAAKPEPVTSDVQFEKDSYQPGETSRFWVHSWQTFSNQPATPADEWKLIMADGREIEPSAIEARPEAGIVSGEFQLPPDGPAGNYSLRAVNHKAGTSTDLGHVSVGIEAAKSGELARRARFAGNGRNLRMLQNEMLAEMSADKKGEKDELKLPLAKAKTELAAAAADAQGAPSAAPPRPHFAAVAPETESLQNGVAGSLAKTSAGSGQRVQIENKPANGPRSYDRSGGANDQAQNGNDVLVVNVPPELAHMNLWAVVSKANVTVAAQPYQGRSLDDAQAKDSKSSEKFAAIKAAAPAAEAAAAVSESAHKTGLAEQQLGRPGQLSVPLPPEADGELGVTLYDRSAQPPRPVYRQLVRRASSRDLNISAVPEVTSLASPQDLRVKLTVTDHRGNPVPNSYFAARVVKADVANVQENAPAPITRFAADKLSMASPGGGGRAIAPGAPRAASGAGFGGGGKSLPQDGDAKEGKKDQPRKEKGLDRETKEEAEAQPKEARDGAAKPAELAGNAAIPAPPARAGAQNLAGKSEAGDDLAKKWPEEDRAMREELAPALAYSEVPSAGQPSLPHEVLLASNDSLVRSAERAQEAAAQAVQASVQRMIGKVLLAVAAAALLLLGLLAILHRPAQAKIWIPAMIVVAGSFVIGCFWLMSGNFSSREVAGNATLAPEQQRASSKVDTEDVEPMAPAAARLPLPIDDVRSEGAIEKGAENASAIGPTVELPGGIPPGRAEKKSADFVGPRRGGAGGFEYAKPGTMPIGGSKPEPAARSNELRRQPAEPSAPGLRLHAEEEKKKLEENRHKNESGLARSAKDAANSKQDVGSQSAPKPVTMQSALAASSREKRFADQNLLWQPSLPANDQGEAELNIQLPTEEGDYYLLVDVQSPNGVGTIQRRIPVHVPAALPAAPAKP
jgi:hypothetical protein